MKKILIYSMMALSLMTTSCEKFLDVKPQSQIPTEDIFKQETGYEDALIGCYVKMTTDELYGRFLTLEGLDFMAQYYSEAPNTSLQGALKEFNYKNEEVEAQLKATYNAFYNAILHVNEVIEHISAPAASNVVKSELKRKVLKGEALGLRAFLHFDLLRLYGQIPQNAVKTVSLPYSEKTGVEDRPLYDFKSYVDKVLSDLTEAEQLLAEDPVLTHNLRQHVYKDVTDKFYHYRRFRFNYFAVKALQARVCLYVGEKEKAYSAARQLVGQKEKNGTSYFQLAGNEDFQLGNFALPGETIFGLSNNQLQNERYEILFKNRKPGNYMNFSPKRKKELFKGRNTSVNNRFNKIWGEHTSINGTTLNYYKKYLQNEEYGNDQRMMDDRCFYPMFRVSEMYLIMMETSNDLNEINQLFTTYFLARNEQLPAPFDNLENARKEVIDEYRREFMAEGQMFFTYKRLGTKAMKWRNQEVTETDYVVPVPASEITK